MNKAPILTDEPSKTQIFLRLIAYLKPYYWAIPLIVLGFGLVSATQATFSYLMKMIIQAIETGDRHTITWFPFILLFVFAVRGIGSFLGGYYSAFMARSLVYTLRMQVFDKLLRMPSKFYLDNPAGTISSKLIFDVEQVTAASNDALTTILKDGLTVLFLLAFLFYLNWKITLVLFVVVPPIVWLINKASKKFASLAKDIQDSMSEVSHITNETIGGYQVVKNYGGQAYELQRFNQSSLKNLKQGMKITVLASINTPLVQFLMALGACFVIWLSLRPEVLGDTGAGEFVAFLAAMGMLSSPVKALTDVNNRLQRGIMAGRSIFNLLDSAEERDFGTKTPVLTGQISFKNVGLSYHNNEHYVIDGFNLDIKAGESVAIVGRSGSGKTSLVNLLTRSLEPTKGEILLDGVALQDIKLDSLRSQIAMVNQQIVLFSDTVAHNIAYGSLSVKSFDEVVQASKSAYADEFIAKLPNGYDTQIGADGLQLSGGQRQRLSIARALLKDAPILILDEATSALDNESEFFIQKALDEVMKNRTTIVIAHRLSTIEKADRIVVMDKGQIVEMGTHTELLAKGGQYKAMHERDFLENGD